MLMERNRRGLVRFVWTLVLGLFLGGLLTHLLGTYLPDGPPRSFFTTSVVASAGPISIDLVAVAVTLGPLELSLNVLTLVGIAIVALFVRAWI
jgi:hypothetical protein